MSEMERVNFTYGNKHIEYANSCESNGLYSDALIWYHKAYFEYEVVKKSIDAKDFELLREINKKAAYACKKMEEMEEKIAEKPKHEDSLEL